MKELKVIKPHVVVDWTFNGTQYTRSLEAKVLCNFEGHGGVEKVSDLIKALQKLPQDAIFTVDDDEQSGRMAIFVNFKEVREATQAEISAEITKAIKQIKDQVELDQKRKTADALLKNAKQRQGLAKKLDDTRKAISLVRAELQTVRAELQNPHVSEEEDLQETLQELKLVLQMFEAEEAQLIADLSAL